MSHSNLQYSHLLGQPFQLGRKDCFTLVREFYTHNFGLEIPNYARPALFWEHKLDLYMKLFHRHGFRTVDVPPREVRPGDGLLMAIRSPIANHAAVVVEGGKIIHHCYNQLSREEAYIGVWQHMTVAVLRHPDVKYEPPPMTQLDLLELLPPHARERFLAAVSDRRT